MLQIRAATPLEVDDVLAVLDDAAAWLHSKGISEQWPASLSSDAAWLERFQRWTEEGRVFLARDSAGSAVGCFRLMSIDIHIWADDGGRYFYLHSLAVRRSAGDGVAASMLAWARQYATTQGAEELRLDCWAGNARLIRYYTEAGFEPRGEAHVIEGEDGQWSITGYWVAKFAWRLR